MRISTVAIFFSTLFSLLVILSGPNRTPSIAGEFDIDVSATKGCEGKVTTPNPRTNPLPNARKLLPSEKGIYPGLYAIGAMEQHYDQFMDKIGKPPVIVFTFHDFILADRMDDENPPIQTFAELLEGDSHLSVLDFAKQLSKKGSVLAVTWDINCCDFESTLFWLRLKDASDTVSRLLRGDFDADIKRAAREIKDFGHPIMIAPFAEFSNQGPFLYGKSGTERIDSVDNICSEYGDPAWPDGPERIRDTHIHIIDLFRQEGVKNVTWFMYATSNYMNPTIDGFFSEWMHPKYFYPGDAYIDWVGQSTYFIDPDPRPDVNANVVDVKSALEPGYKAWGEVTQHPMFLPEFGPSSDGKQSRAKILRHVLEDFLPSMSRVRAFTFADAKLFELHFELPRLGNFPDEITAWKQSVNESDNYIFTPKFTDTDPPSPDTDPPLPPKEVEVVE